MKKKTAKAEKTEKPLYRISRISAILTQNRPKAALQRDDSSFYSILALLALALREALFSLRNSIVMPHIPASPTRV